MMRTIGFIIRKEFQQLRRDNGALGLCGFLVDQKNQFPSKLPGDVSRFFPLQDPNRLPARRIADLKIIPSISGHRPSCDATEIAAEERDLLFVTDLHDRIKRREGDMIIGDVNGLGPPCEKLSCWQDLITA